LRIRYTKKKSDFLKALIQTFHQWKGDILEFQQGLPLVVFHELVPVLDLFKGDDLPSHGPVNVTPDDVGCLIAVDGGQSVVIRYIDGLDVRLLPGRVIFLDVEVLLEHVLGPVEKDPDPSR
jgi:hypothetical protein